MKALEIFVATLVFITAGAYAFVTGLNMLEAGQNGQPIMLLGSFLLLCTSLVCLLDNHK
jgi:hypothetical protein